MDQVEIHKALNIAGGDYTVDLTLSTMDALEEYRMLVDNDHVTHNAIIVIPHPMYAGEKIDRTKAPLVFRNGTQELSGWPEPESE